MTCVFISVIDELVLPSQVSKSLVLNCFFFCLLTFSKIQSDILSSYITAEYLSSVFSSTFVFSPHNEGVVEYPNNLQSAINDWTRTRKCQCRLHKHVSQKLKFLLLDFNRNDTNTLILPDLGKLRQVRILHDNSGTTPSWFLQKVRYITFYLMSPYK